MSEFDQYFKKKKRDDAALAATTALTSPLVPDQFAYNRGLAKMLNVSAGVVSSAPEMFADKLKQKQDTESLLDSEKIRGWLLTPENAAIAADDIGNLTNFERISKSFQQADVNLIGRSQRVSRDVAASLETSRLGQMLDSASSTFDEKLLIGEDGKPNMLGRIANTFRRAGAESDGVPRSLVGGERVTLESRADAIGDKPLNTIGQMAARRAAQFDEDGFAPMRHQEVDSFGSAMMFIAENIAASAPQMAVSFASGGFAPLLNVSMFAGEVNDEMSERTDLSRDQRVAIAVSTGVAMSALEMFGLSKIFGDLLPGNIAMDAVNGVLADKIVKNGFSVAAAKTLQAGIAEGSTELLQEGLVIGVTALSGGRYKEGEILERLTASLITGGAVGAGLRGSAAIPTAGGKEFVRLLSKVNKTGQSAKTLSDVDAVASGSNLKTRAPDKFLEALEAAGLSEQDLYIPAQDVREYFQSQNLAEAEIERWGISPEIFAEKIASGGDIVMPISDYAANISGTPDADWMRENAVLDPNEMSPAQALRFNEDAAKVFQDAFDEAAVAQEANDATRASDVQVFDAMQSELRAAGRSPDVAQNEARVWQSFWNSMAERYGEDPLDLAQRFGVRVQGPNRDIVAGRRRGDLDIMLNTLRKGEPKATGQSLIPFLRSLGGLQDFGGDVAAMGAPKGLVSATRADRDNRQVEFGGVPAPLPGIGLDVAARRAVEAGFFPDLLAQIADNSGLEGDLVAPLLESISENLSGNLSFIEGQGPDADLTALSAELDRVGVNIDDSNEVIIAALDAEAGIDAGDEYNQSGNLKTNTPEFKAWFGDSKVVDADGEPLVVYHGTAPANSIGGVKDFDSFRPLSHFGTVKAANERLSESGFKSIEGMRVLPVYLKIENPVEIEDNAIPHTAAALAVELQDKVGFSEEIVDYIQDGFDETEQSSRLAEALFDVGVDGLFYENVYEDAGSKSWVIVSPDGVKSVNNRGTFDKSDPRILYQSIEELIKFADSSIAADVDADVDSVVGVLDQYPAAIPPEYEFSNYEAVGGVMAEMSPDEFLALSSEMPIDETVLDNVNDLAGMMLEGRKIDPPTLSIRSDGRVDKHDGRHRALAAKRLGIETMPVLLMGDDAGAFIADINAIKAQAGSIDQGAVVSAKPARELFQGDKKRGSIQFPRGGLAEGETVINLFESANLSTFLHESGHFFLEAFTELAGQDAAPADMQADLQAIRDFLGAAPGEKFETEHHEKWARGFEAYTLEGKAPSLALADAFARFKSWLMRIYRSALDLNVKLTPEIRDVMDRMLATEAEIAEARESMSLKPLFTDQAPDGMADIDYKTYQRMAQRSVDQAEQRLLKKTMAKVKRSREAWFKTETAAVRLEVEGEINSRREHRLVEMLANKKWFGSDRDVPDMRIDRAQLVEMFGEGVIPEISRQKLGGKRAIYGVDGESPQGVATFFGFESVTEMIDQLQNTPKRLDAINLETDRRMTERYGDPLNDGSIEEDALLAIHADQQAATVIAEARHLNTRAGRPTSNTNAKVYRARARQMINDMPVRDVMRPDTFLNAERKAAREAEQSFAQVARNGRKSGEALERAAVAKERQLINHYLYREARDAQDWIGKGREKARSYAVKKTREKIGTGFIEQIDSILERFDFRVRSKKQVERSESLRDFVRRMTDEGREAELSISDKLLDETRRMHFTRLPVGELRGVFDTIDNLDHMGRFKRKLIDQKNKRDLDETVGKVTNALATNIGKKEPGRFKRKGDDRRKDARDYLNLTLNADTLLREVDGFADLGDAYTSIKQPIDEGMNRLTERRLQMANDLDEIYKVYDAATLREMSKKKSIAALGLEATQWEIISIALNTGNNDNYQRLTNPKTKGGFTEDQVNGALRELTEQDWRTVQSMWDYINGYWTEIAAKEKRTTGVVPTKVESKLMVDAPAFVKGGYYPIKYDSKLSGRATDMDQEALTQALMGGRHGKAQTANGHTKERALNVTMPLKLDLSVAHSHLAQVLYDLEIGEAVTNSWRVLQDNRVKDAFIDSGKQSDHQALEIWLQDVAAGDRVSARGMEVGLRHLRSGFVVSRLALNISTALIQPTGLAQSAVVVGKRATAAGVVEFVKNPNRWVNEAMKASSFMRERQTTFERDIFNVVGDLESGPVTSRWAKFQRDIILPMSFLMMQKTQFYVVDMPTWVGAYNKEIKQSADHERALLYADRMVARSQGSGLMSDRGMLERGTTDKNSRQRELPRMLTALGSYMFAKGNVAYESTMKTSFRDPLEVMKWAVDMSLLFTFEAVLYSAVKGFGPEEDEDFTVWLLKETGFSAMSTVPILREISGGLQGFGSGGILGSTLDKAFIKPITQAQQGEYDKALVKSLVDMSGIWFHLPSSQTNTVLNAVFEDDMGVKKEIDPFAAIGVGTGRGNSLADYFMEGE